MKALVFADLHGSEKALKKIEQKAKKVGLLLCLGDFTIFGQHQERILKKINDFGKLCLLIHGNHETASEIDALCKKYSNLLFVHKKVLRVGRIIFIGYGGGGFSLCDRDFETKYGPRFLLGIKNYKEIIMQEQKVSKTVLLLHGPPYGSKVDRIGDQHCGNKSFRDFYMKHHIDYVFSGHLHETAGAVEHIHGTTLINPGPVGVLLEL